MNGIVGLATSLFSTLALFVDSLLLEVGATALTGEAELVDGVTTALLVALLSVLFTAVVFSLVLTVLLTFEGAVVLSSLALAWLSLANTGNNVAAAKAGISTYLILFFFHF